MQKSSINKVSVRTIGERAFLDCINLSEIMINGSLPDIDGNAFRYCTSINRFNIDGSQINALNQNSQTFLERLIHEDNTPQNVIKALIFSGANIVSTAGTPGLHEQMVGWIR